MPRHLTWYWRRLRAMTPAEVAGRTRRTLHHRADAVSFHVARSAWRMGWEPEVAALLGGEIADAPRGFLQPLRAERLREHFADDVDRLVARASSVLAGRIRFFGYPEIAFEPARSQDLDPLSGRHWPPKHGKRIDYRHEQAGDPKLIWELNRCQDLPMLAAAWLVSGDARYAAAAGERLATWIESHPPGRGIAWANGFEAGIRGMSLAVTLDALRGTEFMPPARLRCALLSLWQHARWIEGDPSRGSSANNHRIGELVGLVVMGALAPELKDAARWVEDGVAALADESKAQIRPDGTNVEQAFPYDVFVLDLLLVAVAALDSSGCRLPPELRSALERSGDALWAQLGDDEPDPSYGDGDDGRALILDGDELRTARGVAAGIAARFGHANAARVAGRLDATALWLFGQSGAERFSHIEPAAEPGSVTLPDGGLTILRAGSTRTIFDHGPHGHLSIAAHAHADALAVDVALGNARLVGDPGVGSYFARPKLREAFRGTGFHATVLVDELDSSVQGGPFLWTEQAKSRLVSSDLVGGVVVAEHDGYMRLGDPVLHRRAVVQLGEDAIVVVDRLYGELAHRYSQRWPLHPALELGELAEDQVVARGSEVGLVLAFSGSHAFVVNATRGEEDSPCGWWSARLESVQASLLVSAEADASGPMHMATLLCPFPGASPPEARIELDGSLSRIEVIVGRRTEHIEMDPDSLAVVVRPNVPAGAA